MSYDRVSRTIMTADVRRTDCGWAWALDKDKNTNQKYLELSPDCANPNKAFLDVLLSNIAQASERINPTMIP